MAFNWMSLFKGGGAEDAAAKDAATDEALVDTSNVGTSTELKAPSNLEGKSGKDFDFMKTYKEAQQYLPGPGQGFQQQAFQQPYSVGSDTSMPQQGSNYQQLMDYLKR